MSKTSQRKQTLYNEGYRDGKEGNGVKWAAHEFLSEFYLPGYRKGEKERKLEGLLENQQVT